MIAGLNIKLDELIWGDVLHKYGLPGRLVAGILRNLYAVLRDIFTGQLTLRAMSLVYTTLLSVVPLIAVSFAVLKGFGVDKDLEQYLYGVLEPLGEKGVEITGQVMNLVDNVHGGVIGGIGLAFFVYTAISMVQKIEESFNYVWYVSKPRSFATRFVEYSAVLIIGTLAVTLALRTVASLGKEDLVVSMQENTMISPIFEFASSLTPYAVIIAIFTFLYKFMPNTNVKLRSALVGGCAGGFLWITASMLFGAFVTNSYDRQAIYASFAIAITALIWLYLNWLILLIGSQLAFYFQNPAYMKIGRREPRLSNAMRERLALNIMLNVGTAFRDSSRSIDLRALSSKLRIPSITVAPIILGLEAAGLLTTAENEELLPGREMARIKLNDILAVVRVEGETGSHREPRWSKAVATLGATIDSAVESSLGEMTLSQLLDETEQQA
ncbi:MAG: YihY/virulence factor BrkB family protein [Gammaproteobacteria bacterium]|nr:YihY/virulence factor BrkB family protein [Gammaproteobacteria bacterium]